MAERNKMWRVVYARYWKLNLLPSQAGPWTAQKAHVSQCAQDCAKLTGTEVWIQATDGSLFDINWAPLHNPNRNAYH